MTLNEVLDLREWRMGRVFGQEGLVVRFKADLKPLRLAVFRLMAVSDRYGVHGNLLKSGDEFDLVRKLSLELVPEGISLVGLTTVRIKPAKSDRGHDTYQMHSDVWAGEPSGVILMIPICGDFESGGVEFYKPSKGEVEWFKPYKDYRLAPDFGPQYLGKMDEEHVCAVDAFCLHRTALGGFRVSVDLRLVFTEQIPYDSVGLRIKNYEGYSR